MFKEANHLSLLTHAHLITLPDPLLLSLNEPLPTCDHIKTCMYVLLVVGSVSKYTQLFCCVVQTASINDMNICVLTETIGVEVLLKNSLDVDINLTKISLIWEMEQKLGHHQVQYKG